MVKMRDGVELATDVYLPDRARRRPFPRGAHPHALRQRRLRRHEREILCQAWLCRHLSGRARPAPFEGRLLLASRQRVARAPRRLRHHRVGGDRAMVEWQGGNDGLVFHLREPASDGSHETAPSRSDVLRRVRLESLPGRLLRRRRASHDHAHLAPHPGGNGEAASGERPGPGRIPRERRSPGASGTKDVRRAAEASIRTCSPGCIRI